MINRIMNRLHRVFNKDPQAYPVMVVTSTVSGTIDINNSSITITHRYATNTLPLADKTLNQIKTEIDALPYLSAALYQPEHSALLAKGILPAVQQTLADGRIYMPASIFYNEMQVYAGMLQGQADRVQDANNQLYFHSATEDWLNYWGKEHFGNPRQQGEPDSQYLSRIVAEIIKIKQNNKAMEISLKQAVSAVECLVKDADFTNGTSLLYDGRAKYSGNDRYAYKYGSQPGCFYITADLPSEDTRTLDQITSTLVSTANRVKAAGTKLDGVIYKTSTSDTATISETATIVTHDTQPDILPWGLRYDGSVLHNSGRLLTFDGADTYNGDITYRLAVDGETTYSNEWDSSTATIHTDQADQHQVSIAYNGLASYDGVFDQGATPPPLYDTRMTVTARRHNLFSGLRTYGSGKQYDGSWLADGSTDYQQMRYEGIHTIQEITI